MRFLIALLIFCGVTCSAVVYLPIYKPDAPIYDIWIMGGQSMISGYTQTNPVGISMPPIPIGMVWRYVPTSNAVMDAATVAPYTANGQSNQLQNAFVLQWNALTGHKVVVIDASRSGTFIVPGQSIGGAGNWQDSVSASVIGKTNLIGYWSRATNYMATNSAFAGATLRFNGILWSQGESEGTSIASVYNQYGTALTNLFTWFSTNLPPTWNGDKLVKVIRSGEQKINPTPINLLTEDFVGFDLVRTTQTVYCATSPLARMVFWSSLWYVRDLQLAVDGVNNLHWSQFGFNQAGTNAALECYAQGSTFTNPTAPASFSVAATNGLSVRLTWATNSNPNFRFYRIYQGGSASNSFQLVDQIAATNTTYLDEWALVAGSNYTYYVASYNEFTETPSVTNSATLPSQPVSAASYAARTGVNGNIATNIWNVFSASNLLTGLRCFVPTMTPYQTNSNFGLVDLVTNLTINFSNVIVISDTGIRFTNKTASSLQRGTPSKRMMPLNGPWCVAMLFSNLTAANADVLLARTVSGVVDTGNAYVMNMYLTTNRINFFYNTIRTDFSTSAWQTVTYSTLGGTGLTLDQSTHLLLANFDGTAFTILDNTTNGAVAWYNGALRNYFRTPSETGVEVIGNRLSQFSPGFNLMAVASWNRTQSMATVKGALANCFTNITIP